MMKKYVLLAVAAIFVSSVAEAQILYLDFENVAPVLNDNSVEVGSYYNGGTSSIGTSGNNFGVSFGPGASILCLNTQNGICSNGSRGGQGIPTSQLAGLYFASAERIVDVAAGFSAGFSGVYANPYAASATVDIYDNLGGTGALLASFALSETANAGCAPAIADSANFCPFETFSLAFTGTARSVSFGGDGGLVFDDLTFGSTEVGAVPEPTTWAMLIVGFGITGAAMRRRSKAVARYI